MISEDGVMIAAGERDADGSAEAARMGRHRWMHDDVTRIGKDAAGRHYGHFPGCSVWLTYGTSNCG